MISLNENVVTIMSKSPISVAPNTTLEDVRNLMNSKMIRHIIVEDEGKLLGIISIQDLQKWRGRSHVKIKAEDIMIQNVRTLEIDDTIKDAAEVFLMANYHSLPIMDAGKVVGIITTTDILKHILNKCQ